MFRYRFTTNPGLESIVADELEARGFAARRDILLRPAGREGRVDAATDDSLAPQAIALLRSVYHAVAIDGERTIEGLGELAPGDALKRIGRSVEECAPPGIDRDRSLAVRCVRTGNHTFHSPDVERSVGALLVGRHGCPVDLTNPSITVRIDIDGDRVAVGRLASIPGMDRRFEWAYRPRVALKTVVAFALLRLALRPSGREGPPDAADRTDGALLDPFCGSGTMALMALESGLAQCRGYGPARDQRRPVGAGWAHQPAWSGVFASDRSAEAVAGTRANLAWNGAAGCVVVRQADARSLVDRWGGRGVASIVCNPPYGVRLGRSIGFPAFYRALLDGAYRVLPRRGRLVLMASRRRGALNAVLQHRPEWAIRHVRVIETGGVYPGIFVLERD